MTNTKELMQRIASAATQQKSAERIYRSQLHAERMELLQEFTRRVTNRFFDIYFFSYDHQYFWQLWGEFHRGNDFWNREKFKIKRYELDNILFHTFIEAK